MKSLESLQRVQQVRFSHRQGLLFIFVLCFIQYTCTYVAYLVNLDTAMEEFYHEHELRSATHLTLGNWPSLFGESVICPRITTLPSEIRFDWFEPALSFLVVVLVVLVVLKLAPRNNIPHLIAPQAFVIPILAVSGVAQYAEQQSLRLVLSDSEPGIFRVLVDGVVASLVALMFSVNPAINNASSLKEFFGRFADFIATLFFCLFSASLLGEGTRGYLFDVLANYCFVLNVLEGASAPWALLDLWSLEVRRFAPTVGAIRELTELDAPIRKFIVLGLSVWRAGFFMFVAWILGANTGSLLFAVFLVVQFVPLPEGYIGDCARPPPKECGDPPPISEDCLVLWEAFPFSSIKWQRWKLLQVPIFNRMTRSRFINRLDLNCLTQVRAVDQLWCELVPVHRLVESLLNTTPFRLDSQDAASLLSLLSRLSEVSHKKDLIQRKLLCSSAVELIPKIVEDLDHLLRTSYWTAPSGDDAPFGHPTHFVTLEKPFAHYNCCAQLLNLMALCLHPAVGIPSTPAMLNARYLYHRGAKYAITHIGSVLDRAIELVIWKEGPNENYRVLPARLNHHDNTIEIVAPQHPPEHLVIFQCRAALAALTSSLLQVLYEVPQFVLECNVKLPTPAQCHSYVHRLSSMMFTRQRFDPVPQLLHPPAFAKLFSFLLLTAERQSPSILKQHFNENRFTLWEKEEEIIRRPSGLTVLPPVLRPAFGFPSILFGLQHCARVVASAPGGARATLLPFFNASLLMWRQNILGKEVIQLVCGVATACLAALGSQVERSEHELRTLDPADFSHFVFILHVDRILSEKAAVTEVAEAALELVNEVGGEAAYGAAKSTPNFIPMLFNNFQGKIVADPYALFSLNDAVSALWPIQKDQAEKIVEIRSVELARVFNVVHRLTEGLIRIVLNCSKLPSGVKLVGEEDLQNCKGDDECAVCLNSLRDAGTEVRSHGIALVQKCQHMFHHQCLLLWLIGNDNTTCPMCHGDLHLSV